MLRFRFEGDAQAEEEFNNWYNTVHAPHVLECPGFIAGYRYRDVDDPHCYVTLYVFKSEDSLQQAHENFRRLVSQEEHEQWRVWEKQYLKDHTRTIFRQLYP